MLINETKQSLSFDVNPLTVIDRVIAELELTPTQYNDAVKSYEAVADVLRKIHPSLILTIFPQGSMRLGTTVRPQFDDQFDLDMVCLVSLSGKIYSPEQIFNLVWEALGKDGTYLSLVDEPVTDLLEFVVKVITRLPEYINVTGATGFRKFSVNNPVNQFENFAESWTEEHYQQFLSWHGRFTSVLQKLHDSRGNGLGMDEMIKSLSTSFGKDRIIRAANSLGADTSALHDDGKLRTVGGTLASVGATVRPTIFYGGEK